MGLFDKKTCDFCGAKIGLLGNKKLEDGNMCKDCAAKLSPWFSERRQSTKEEIAGQLAYREENRKAVAAFHPTRSIGKYTRLLIDEDAKKFMVTSSSKLSEANPDVLEFGQVTGCNLDIDENRHELMTKDPEGKSVSYDPPRYEYSYAFSVEAFVNHPYFDRMRWSISNGHVKTGETPMAGDFGLQAGAVMSPGLNEYVNCLQLGNEIRGVLEAMRTGTDLPSAEGFVVSMTEAPMEAPTEVPLTGGAEALPIEGGEVVVPPVCDPMTAQAAEAQVAAVEGPTGAQTVTPTATPTAEDGTTEARIIVCPCCGACVWAKRDGLRLLCLDCGQQMKYV